MYCGVACSMAIMLHSAKEPGVSMCYLIDISRREISIGLLKISSYKDP